MIWMNARPHPSPLPQERLLPKFLSPIAPLNLLRRVGRGVLTAPRPVAVFNLPDGGVRTLRPTFRFMGRERDCAGNLIHAFARICRRQLDLERGERLKQFRRILRAPSPEAADEVSAEDKSDSGRGEGGRNSLRFRFAG
jgi:hypothetical protein